MSNMSHPTMGAWIEIFSTLIASLLCLVSHPTMGAWIEIFTETTLSLLCIPVAPHDGCVD